MTKFKTCLETGKVIPFMESHLKRSGNAFSTSPLYSGHQSFFGQEKRRRGSSEGENSIPVLYNQKRSEMERDVLLAGKAANEGDEESNPDMVDEKNCRPLWNLCMETFLCPALSGMKSVYFKMTFSKTLQFNEKISFYAKIVKIIYVIFRNCLVIFYAFYKFLLNIVLFKAIHNTDIFTLFIIFYSFSIMTGPLCMQLLEQIF